jgi:SpoIID/LytB domain protein
MTKTVFEIQSATQDGRFSVPDDTEIAICISAVLSYTGSQEVALGSTGKEAALAPCSNWVDAARLEQTITTRKYSHCREFNSSQLWLRTSRPLLLLFLCFFSFLPCYSQIAPQPILREASSLAATQPTGPLIMRVALALNSTSLALDALDGAEVRQAPRGNLVAVLPPQTSWSITAEGNNLAFTGKSSEDFSPVPQPTIQTAQHSSRMRHVAYYPAVPLGTINRFKFPLTIVDSLADDQNLKTVQYFVIPRNKRANECAFALNGKLYRGWLSLRASKAATASATGALSAINFVDLEDYLLSVVPSEMPSKWPEEALKAQAIGARSYAVANIGKHGKDDYDVRSTVEDQVYLGITSESEATNIAVAKTEGLVLKNKGQVISAFFHSTSGGSTERAEVVWGKSLPFLKSVPDYDDLSPHFCWQRKFSPSELENAITKSTAYDIGKLLTLMVVARSLSQRSTATLLAGTNASHLVDGETLRRVLRLPSTIFNVTCDNGNYVFCGRGFGHGLGMSQWGARALAKQGYNAAQILAYYYKDVSVEYLSKAPGI